MLHRLHGTSSQYQTHQIIISVPNLITVLGLVGVVMYGLLAVRAPENLTPLLTLAVLIILSDALDGLAADWLDQHSRLGKVIDPLRDRCFAAVLLLHILVLHPVWWFAVPILLIVLTELMLAWTFVQQKREEVHSLGKTKTVGQWLLLGSCVIFYEATTSTIVMTALCLSAVLSAVSLAAYWLTKPG